MKILSVSACMVVLCTDNSMFVHIGKIIYQWGRRVGLWTSIVVKDQPVHMMIGDVSAPLTPQTHSPIRTAIV